MLVIYRAKFAPTVFMARQMINHGHIKVNKKRVKYEVVVRSSDTIEVRENQKLTVIDGFDKVKKEMSQIIS